MPRRGYLGQIFVVWVDFGLNLLARLRFCKLGGSLVGFGLRGWLWSLLMAIGMRGHWHAWVLPWFCPLPFVLILVAGVIATRAWYGFAWMQWSTGLSHCYNEDYTGPAAVTK